MVDLPRIRETDLTPEERRVLARIRARAREKEAAERVRDLARPPAGVIVVADEASAALLPPPPEGVVLAIERAVWPERSAEP